MCAEGESVVSESPLGRVQFKVAGEKGGAVFLMQSEQRECSRIDWCME